MTTDPRFTPDLKPFKTNSECSKCGTCSASVCYCFASLNDRCAAREESGNDNIVLNPYMERTCDTCGHVRYEVPLDQLPSEGKD